MMNQTVTYDWMYWSEMTPAMIFVVEEVQDIKNQSILVFTITKAELCQEETLSISLLKVSY